MDGYHSVIGLVKHLIPAFLIVDSVEQSKNVCVSDFFFLTIGYHDHVIILNILGRDQN